LPEPAVLESAQDRGLPGRTISAQPLLRDMTTPAQSAAATSGRRFSRILWSALAALAFVGPTLLWISFDQSVWMWDQSYYGEVAADLLRTLFNEPKQWPRAVLSAIPLKPPLLSWIGQFLLPLGMLADRPEAALLLTNVVANLATLMAVGLIARRIAPNSWAVTSVGVAITAASPLFIGLGGQYLVEPLQTSLAALFWLLAVCANGLSGWFVLSAAALVFVLGLACKTTTELYVAAPGLIILYELAQKRDWLRRPTRAEVAVLGLAIAVTALTAAWYVHNLTFVFDHIRSASTEDALDYGWIADFSSKFRTWISLFLQSTMLPPTTALVALCLVAWIIGIAVGWRERRDSLFALVLFVAAVAQILMILAFFSSNIVVDERYIEPIVPALAVALIAMAAGLPKWANVLLTTVIVTQFTFVQAISFGVWPSSPLVSQWVRPIERNPARKLTMGDVVDFTCSKPEESAFYKVIGVEYPYMNANTADFYSAVRGITRGWRCPYTSIGYAQKDAGAAMARLDDLNADYFISVPRQYQQPINFVNVVSGQVLERVEASNQFIKVPVNFSDRVVMFRRLR
jgi:hypothetical protein